MRYCFWRDICFNCSSCEKLVSIDDKAVTFRKAQTRQAFYVEEISNRFAQWSVEIFFCPRKSLIHEVKFLLCPSLRSFSNISFWKIKWLYGAYWRRDRFAANVFVVSEKEKNTKFVRTVKTAEFRTCWTQAPCNLLWYVLFQVKSKRERMKRSRTRDQGSFQTDGAICWCLGWWLWLPCWDSLFLMDLWRWACNHFDSFPQMHILGSAQHAGWAAVTF